MRLFVNFGAAFLFVLVIAAMVYVYFYLNNSMEGEKSGTRGRFGRKKTIFFQKKKSDQDTVFVQMPVIWYRIPGQDWQSKKMRGPIITMGRDASCDIVIEHPTVSRKQAEIRMKIHRFYSAKNGARYYILKNCAMENPVQYCPQNGGEDDVIDIVRSMKIKEKESVFFLGQVEVMFVLPNRKRVKSSSGPEYEEPETKKEEETLSEEIKKEQEKKQSGGVKRSDPRSQVRF